MEIHNNRPVAVKASTQAPRPSEVPRADQASSADSSALRREITGPLAQKILENSGIKPVEISRYRVQLDIDDNTGRVVAEVRKKDSGELVTEVPSRTLLRQAAMLREALGMILDKPV